MKILAGFFAILGLALHLRLYRIFADPVLAQHHESLQQDGASIVGLILFLAIPWIPLIFYLTCLGYCFVKTRNRITMAIGGAMILISSPYFLALYELVPSAARMCLYAGGLAIYNHLSTPARTSSTPDSGLLSE